MLQSNKTSSIQQDRRTKKFDQNDDSYQLKMQKMEKQIDLLNLDIKIMLQEKAFKQKVESILIKQKKKLQRTFLYQEMQISSGIQKTQRIQKIEKKSQLKDINLHIKNCIQKIKPTKQQGQIIQNTQSNKLNNLHLQCQSKHLKQIFNPEQSINTKQKVDKLRQKLSLVYTKIQLNLQKQQPYLHEKILQRIKRQAKKYSRSRLFIEIQKIIKQNSQWMTQQTNRVNSKLQQQSIEQICVANLGLMKKIMSKKVNNNDFIYQNYLQNNLKNSNQTVKTYPVNKIRKKLQQVIKKIQQNKISLRLNMFNVKENEQKNITLIQVLKDPILQKLITSKKASKNPTFQNNQSQMLLRLSKTNSQLEKLIK